MSDVLTAPGGLDQARLFAALSGPFEPLAALQGARAGDPANLAMAASQLAEFCDTSPAGAGDRWLMRTPQRHFLLKSLHPDELAAAAETRRDAEVDAETADLLAVLLDEPPLSRQEIETLVSLGGDRGALERVIVALDRAGEVAPAHDLLQSARAALTEFDRAENRQRVAERGFFGREEELAQVQPWLETPFTSPPVTCLFVTGPPGIGKSSLLGESVRRFYEGRDPLLLRLDFDRAGLDVQDQLGLTMEAARQIGEQLGPAGAAVLDARLEAGRLQGSGAKEQLTVRQSLPDPLARMIGQAAAATGRPVLVVLDTLEVLRGRGETHPPRLFGWLDDMVRRGLAPVHVLAAGRGEALDACADRIGWPLDLGGLGPTDAAALLAKLETPPQLWSEVLDLAQGNPLKLRLGAEIARRVGAVNLPRRQRGREVTAGFLYRFLLSRIDDPDLKRLAHPGLIVRRINAELIQRVLAPKLGLGAITLERAQDLLDALAGQHWLVEPDVGAPGFLKHRADMRTLLLPLLYRSAPALCGRLDEAAIGWFAKRPEPWAPLEAVYHQLQLMRRGSKAPSVPVQIAAQFDEEMLGELPKAAQDLVRATRGERTSQGRDAIGPRDLAYDDAGLAREILSVVQRQDWVEGQYIVGQTIEAGGLDVRSQAADAIRAFLWRSGQWAEARRWLRDRDRFDPSDDDLAALPEPLALARIEMRAEFQPDDLAPRLPDLLPLLIRLQSTAIAGTDNAARHGALALLLTRLPTPFRFQRAETRESDLAAAAENLWGGAAGLEARLALELGEERIRRAVPGLSGVGDVPPGRLLATLTPYAGFASNLSVIDGRAWMRDEIAAAASALDAAGALLPGAPTAAVSPLSSHVSHLADLGLFAEWAQAAAFLRRDADVRLIGRAAERWRRTMAGDWAYGRAPSGWSRRGLDETLRARVGALWEALDPEAESLAQLGLWSGTATAGADPAAAGAELAAGLRRRLAGALAAAAPGPGDAPHPEQIARRLLARGAPSAFAPPLAVLTALGGDKTSIGGDDD